MSKDTTTERYVISPGIGIARVGNAPNLYFIGPEAPGQQPQSPCTTTSPSGELIQHWKNAKGEVLRQAARFRVYRVNEAGEAVAEVTHGDGVELRWRVHIANRKAAWYKFKNAMDLGEYAMEEQLRNPSYQGKAREDLVIDPGPRSISGLDQEGEQYHFDSGTFPSTTGGPPMKQVYLGELRTDERGRLLMLGGRGHSASSTGAAATTFANNDGWHDDTSDGTVRVTVVIGDKTYEAEPAMVACCPPNFGQGLYGVVTMYDVVTDLYYEKGMLERPTTKPEFWTDIYPMLRNLQTTQAANEGVFFLFGHGSPADFSNPKLLADLANPSSEHGELRKSLFDWFKNPNVNSYTPGQLPPFYGDAFNDFPRTSKITLAITPTQYAMLERWAQGDFLTTGDGPPAPRELSEYSVAEQPRALDRANLEDILGGPFHPGIELTWTLRLEQMWRAPFRLNILGEKQPVIDDYGAILTPTRALAADGPFAASGPGSLTRLMGVPWQTDEASCRSGYAVGTYLPVPSFWAARVPNQTLSLQSYERMLDTRLSVAQRHKHFDYRQDWLRYFGPGYTTEINNMVNKWDKIGILAPRPGPSDHAEVDLPAQVWVETGLDVQEFHVRTDVVWHQTLRAESFGLEQEQADQAASPADSPHIAAGCERDPIVSTTSTLDSLMQTESDRDDERPTGRRRVRRRDE